MLARELAGLGIAPKRKSEAVLGCDSFLEASVALDGQKLAAVLPDFLRPAKSDKAFFRVHIPKIDQRTFCFHLAWNPRLLRLNPHTVRRRDWLADALFKEMNR